MNSANAPYIKRAQAGDTQAYGVLVEKYQEFVYVLARRVCGNAALAEELAQDVFVKAYLQLRHYRGEASFATWLYRIAYNTAISSLRSLKSRQRAQQTYRQEVTHQEAARKTSSSPGDSLGDFLGDPLDDSFQEEQNARYEALDRAVAALSPQDKLLIECYYYKELKMEEVAYICGLSESNAKVRLHRIRQKLHKQLASHEGN